MDLPILQEAYLALSLNLWDWNQLFQMHLAQSQRRMLDLEYLLCHPFIQLVLGNQDPDWYYNLQL